jgi:hypothetical protein
MHHSRQRAIVGSFNHAPSGPMFHQAIDHFRTQFKTLAMLLG